MTSKSRLAQRVVEDMRGKPACVTVNLGESPLTWLHARGLLSDRLLAAGEALRRDWEKAGLGAHVTMRWEAVPVGRGSQTASPPDPSLAQISARDRFNAAIDDAGAGLADILWRVVCAGEGLSTAEKALGWPSRAGKLVLTLALERIARFYRIA